MKDEKQFCEEHCPKCKNTNNEMCEITRTLDGSYRCKGYKESSD